MIAETAFHRNKKNQNTTSSSSSSDPLPRHSVNNLLEPFHTNILKMRLDKTNPANLTASQTNNGKTESSFDSSNHNPSSEMEKKRKMSPFLTVKPSTAICKDNDDISNNLAADNSAPGEGNPVSSSMTPPMIPNIPSPSFVNSVLNSSRSESKQTSSTAFPTTLSGGGEGQRHGTNTYTNLLRTMNSDNLSSASGGGGDGMYSMSSVHFSDSLQSSKHRSPFPPHFTKEVPCMF